MSSNPVTELAKERKGETGQSDTFIVEGVTLQLVGVSPSVVQDAVARMRPPPVPMWHNPDKGRDEPNPNDPGYLAELEAFRHRQNQVSLDALVMFGAEIVDGFPPEDDRWIHRLKRMERSGVYDFSDIDWDDDVDLEYLFKKYIAIKKEHIARISSIVGLSEEAIAQATASFPGDAGRTTDTGSGDQQPERVR